MWIHSTRSFLIALLLASVAGGSTGCAAAERPAPEGGSTAPDEPTVEAAAANPQATVSDWSAPTDPTTTEPEAGPVRPGTGCEGLGTQITSQATGDRFTRHGDVWSRVESWSCGCPSGPVYVLLYAPQTSPLEVRLCSDASQDDCEGLCRRELFWDLGPALAAAGASDVVFPDPAH